ncbi:MAG: hypothetical protein JNL60_13495 [Bacteroidia bacterium]|nr:hypothetical protein [Bacteroidia bacterium]
MNKDFKIYTELTGGEINITEHSQYNEINAENVTVSENITARLFGTVKNITLKKDSRIFIHGKILGNVNNEGGEIQIFNHGR